MEGNDTSHQPDGKKMGNTAKNLYKMEETQPHTVQVAPKAPKSLDLWEGSFGPSHDFLDFEEYDRDEVDAVFRSASKSKSW